jgi:hypothetical protein
MPEVRFFFKCHPQSGFFLLLSWSEIFREKEEEYEDEEDE